jgi:uroporphyrinogen-III synthase
MSVVLVTRPAGESRPLAAMLEARGYEVHSVPTVATEEREVDWPDVATYDLVVVTSATAAATVPDPRAARRWAAVGGATARALRDRGVETDIVAGVAGGEALAQAIPGVGGARVLFVRGSLAAGGLTNILRARGALVDELVTYDTIEGPEASRATLQSELATGDVAVIVFASGSAVRGFVKLGGPLTIPAVTIGPSTSAAARAAGFAVAAEASVPSATALAAAVESVVAVEGKHDA